MCILYRKSISIIYAISTVSYHSFYHFDLLVAPRPCTLWQSLVVVNMNNYTTLILKHAHCKDIVSDKFIPSIKGQIFGYYGECNGYFMNVDAKP